MVNRGRNWFKATRPPGELPGFTHTTTRSSSRTRRTFGGSEPISGSMFITRTAMEVLTAHDWPGNVRQLEHALEHAFVVTARDVETLAAGALPLELMGGPAATSLAAGGATGTQAATSPKRDRTASPQQQRQEALIALARSGGNKAAAARELGLTRAGLYKRLRRLRIEA